MKVISGILLEDISYSNLDNWKATGGVEVLGSELTPNGTVFLAVFWLRDELVMLG